MYKSILWIMGFLCLIRFANAQVYLPEVISSAGLSNSGSNYDCWTMGEPIVLTLDNGTLVLTQGFHQPNMTIVGVPTPRELPTPFVYPNPSSGQIFLNLAGLGRSGGTVRVVDAHGRLVRSHSFGPISAKPLNLDLSNLSNGVYFLRLTMKNARKPFVFKIEKIGTNN